MNRQNAIIYTRVSTEKQNKSQLGVEAQLKACEDFCKRQGLNVIDVRSECASELTTIVQCYTRQSETLGRVMPMS